MKEFKTYHPVVNFIYFIFVIVCSCFFTHPAALAVSFVCGIVYSAMLEGRKKTRKKFMCMLPIMIMAAVINPIFNHKGTTILGYFPNGNPFTLESAAYGIGAAVMLMCVISWFTCFNVIMTSDKFVYLFGKIIPSLSLVLSMTLRFVPRFAVQLKAVANAQQCIGNAMTGGIIKKIKTGLGILSIMITWSLENAVETACSMKSRGYGLPGRTSFSIFKFDKRDKTAFVYIALFGMYTVIGGICGGMRFIWFPSIFGLKLSLFGISVFAAYFMLCIYPIAIETREVLKWKAIESKI